MKPFRVVLTKDSDGVAAFCPELDLYTCGDTVEETKASFTDLLFEYFSFLVGNRGRLSRKYLRHLEMYRAAVLGKGIEWDSDGRTRLAKSAKS